MKGYYLTYGVFTNELETIVKDLEQELNIKLIRETDADNLDNELFYLDSNPDSLITNFAIIKTTDVYHLNASGAIKPDYLISCNITAGNDEMLKEKYVQSLRAALSQKKYLKELRFDTDEW